MLDIVVVVDGDAAAAAAETAACDHGFHSYMCKEEKEDMGYYKEEMPLAFALGMDTDFEVLVAIVVVVVVDDDDVAVAVSFLVAAIMVVLLLAKAGQHIAATNSDIDTVDFVPVELEISFEN